MLNKILAVMIMVGLANFAYAQQDPPKRKG